MRAMLRRLKRLTNPGARVIAQTVDIYRKPVPPEDAAYFRINRSRGRMSGELRIRVLYKTFRTPWFDYLMASPDEMAEVADGTGWFLERVISYPNWTSPVYFGVLKKET